MLNFDALPFLERQQAWERAALCELDILLLGHTQAIDLQAALTAIAPELSQADRDSVNQIIFDIQSRHDRPLFPNW